MNQPPEIELNPEFLAALRIMNETGKSVFITGRAGTGKSTLLKYFRAHTDKKVAIVAPTGVAALNVQGQTIHSFCRFKPNVTPENIRRLRFNTNRKNIYQKLDAIVIDEISMVRADLLDCVDRFLRLHGNEAGLPFGGIQMIFIGDLYQLPPVVTGQEREAYRLRYQTPYFYGARVFSEFEMEFIELEKVYRQQDQEFVTVLNSIRNRSIDDAGLASINQRYIPGFDPPAGDFYIYLTTTNAGAEKINRERLEKLPGATYHFQGEIQGEFGKEYLPTAVEISLKVGAQVMLLNNDSAGRWVNGTIGEVNSITVDATGETVVTVSLADGGEEQLTPFTWEIYRYILDQEKLQLEPAGSFRQMPLMLAWAVTIHKSQGKTFEKVVIDFERGTFAHGQAYVALSRCTTLEGIVLAKPFRKQHILMDYEVIRFLTRFQYVQSQQIQTDDAKNGLIMKAIETRTPLEITYLKPNDEKTRRVIVPRSVSRMSFKGKTYLGLQAFCLIRGEERNFRLDRILEVKPAAME